MTRNIEYKDYSVIKNIILPELVISSYGIENENDVMKDRPACVSFRNDAGILFSKQGSWILLDFGKEICGGIRIVTRNIVGSQNAGIRITFGESVTESCSDIEESTATNDHSPRDFTAMISTLSDLLFGATGFRFVRIELLDDTQVTVTNIFAESTEPYFKKEASIKTSDKKLNQIIDTAAYTLKLTLQNGYIWDGIKRDRLVWSGDLHQEIINSLYLFGDNVYITNSLEFLKNDTSSDEWINAIPSYSAWWVINLCDYCTYSGNESFFSENYDYAQKVLEHIDRCISDDGKMNFGGGLDFFLDWPTCSKPDAEIGTAAIMMIAANKLASFRDNDVCKSIKNKLEKYLLMPCESKQTRAFQILAGRKAECEDAFFENGGAAGFSTFMAYYILTANAMANGKNSLDIIKEYFGAMLSRGATTFWEDFDMEWLNGSGRIDAFPKDGERDIHADYGNYCYKGFRHSLCHGWSSGVLAFIIESVFGIKIQDGCTKVTVKPDCNCPDYRVIIPLKSGWLRISYKKGDLDVKAPRNVTLII